VEGNGYKVNMEDRGWGWGKGYKKNMEDWKQVYDCDSPKKINDK